MNEVFKLELTENELMSVIIVLEIYLERFNSASTVEKNVEKVIPKLKQTLGIE